MARAYDGRGLTAFTLAMRRNWDDTEAQVEGRPDAEADSVSIITMHLAKGLEWPIVIPINSQTELYDDTTFLHRRSDDTVHFKILDQAPDDYELVKAAERDQVRRERVRLWYVAVTRACDLLLLPRQSERKANDWMSIVDLRIDDLPIFDPRAIVYAPSLPDIEKSHNTQDETTWRCEAATIAAACRSIVWRSPSRHEMPPDAAPEMTVFSPHANAAHTIYVGGVVDALARQPDGSIDLVIDWKTDVDPDLQQIELYRRQVRDYLDATGAPEGLLVFVTTGQLVRVRPAFQPTADAA
jgi:ATP-dependent exoDNAse (exonuclease V) beta subunit